MALMVAQVPSYKWLPLTYQLSSRLGTNPPAKRYSPNDDDVTNDGDDATAATAAAENQSLSPSDSDVALEPVTTFAQVKHQERTITWRRTSCRHSLSHFLHKFKPPHHPMLTLLHYYLYSRIAFTFFFLGAGASGVALVRGAPAPLVAAAHGPRQRRRHSFRRFAEIWPRQR
jgi:hypothetical protein